MSVLLTLLALLAAAGPATGQELLAAAGPTAGPWAGQVPPPAKNLSDPETTINICTSETSPILFCIDREPEDYSGYEIALFERVRQQLGWAPERLNWTCMEWDEMLEHMAAGDGVCDITVAGVDVGRVNLMENGFTFTYPTLSAGYRIMVSTSSQESSVDYWLFMNAFEWKLWLAIVLTCLAVAAILWGVDRWANLTPPPPSALPPDLQSLAFRTLGRPMQNGDMHSRNFAGSFIILIFSFMMLILTALYTGSTAANLTANQLQSNIRSVEDLPGKKVGTYDDPEYIGDLAKRGIKATVYPWDTQEDEQAMYAALRRGEIQALVLDSYVLEYAAASQCDLEVIGGLWKEYDAAVAFPSNFNDQKLLRDYNRVLVTLKDNGDMERLQGQYLSPPEARCKTTGVSSTTTQITFQEVCGLWILLAASVCVACVLALISMLALRSARRLARTQQFQASMKRFSALRTIGSRTFSGRRRQVEVVTVDSPHADGGGQEGGNCAGSKVDDPEAGKRADGTEDAATAEVLEAMRRLEQLLAARGGGLTYRGQ